MGDGVEAAEALRPQPLGGAWRSGIFGFHHFHSTAHEALAVAAGAITVQLGGRGGEVVEVQAGPVTGGPIWRRARSAER